MKNGDKATMNVSLPLSKQHTKVEINMFCLEYGIDDAVECDGLLHVFKIKSKYILRRVE